MNRKLYTRQEVANMCGFSNANVYLYQQEMEMECEFKQGRTHLYTDDQVAELMEYMRGHVKTVMDCDREEYEDSGFLPDGYKQAVVDKFMAEVEPQPDLEDVETGEEELDTAEVSVIQEDVLKIEGDHVYRTTDLEIASVLYYHGFKVDVEPDEDGGRRGVFIVTGDREGMEELVNRYFNKDVWVQLRDFQVSREGLKQMLYNAI